MNSPDAARQRDVLAEVAYLPQYLPKKVEPANAIMVGRLVDRATRRYFELLPNYLEACEKAADALTGLERTTRHKRISQFRERAHEFIRAYRDIAKQVEALLADNSPLRPFSM